MKKRFAKSQFPWFFFLLWSLTTNSFSVSIQSAEKVNWGEVIQGYDRFLSEPSSDKAQSLANVLPKGNPDVFEGDMLRAMEHIFSAENFGILATEAELGNRYALTVLIRLLNHTDGFYSEEALGVLGATARSKPEELLRAFRENRDTWYISARGFPVDFPQYAYNNHAGAYRFDLLKRIEALKSVKNPRYLDIRDACIDRLNERLIKLKLDKDCAETPGRIAAKI